VWCNIYLGISENLPTRLRGVHSETPALERGGGRTKELWGEENFSPTIFEKPRHGWDGNEKRGKGTSFNGTTAGRVGETAHRHKSDSVPEKKGKRGQNSVTISLKKTPKEERGGKGGTQGNKEGSSNVPQLCEEKTKKTAV